MPGSTRSDMPAGWLIGMMGSGKTVVGRKVALRLDLRFVDTDSAIEGEQRMTVSEIFATWGEERFRDLESEKISDLSHTGWLVSTGGGAILRPGNVETMRASGPVVWLRASTETLIRRLAGSHNRPLLVDDPHTRLEEIHLHRQRLYAAAATCVIDTDDLTLDQTVMAVEVML